LAQPPFDETNYIWKKHWRVLDFSRNGGCMDIQDLITEGLIITDLKGHNKYEVIEELLDPLVTAQKVQDRETCLQALLEREEYLSTGLENGLAVPHAKTAAIEEIAISFGLSRSGLDFSSSDGKPTHFVFLVVSPLDTSGPHLKILAQISRNLREPQMGQRLLESKSSAEILRVIHEFK
jgi:fructose-specific phosphotransferase system IIA component